VKKTRIRDPYTVVCERFNQQSIRYVVVGMSAINYYAQDSREIFSTQDFDIFIKPTIENVKKAVQALKGINYSLAVGTSEFQDRMLKETVRDKRTILAVDPYGISIELILAVSGFVFNEMEKDASIFLVGKTPIKVAKLAKLLESKRQADRKKDRIFLKRFDALLAEKTSLSKDDPKSR
jgi:hypothetical protein